VRHLPPGLSKLSVSDKRGFGPLGVFVTRRLREEGFIDADLKRTREVEPGYSVEDPLYLRSWKEVCWCYRIQTAEDPSIQEPSSTPFGYLSGPLFRRGGEPEEVTA
jgi:hypothetical protein